jgi:hypothetical protein
MKRAPEHNESTQSLGDPIVVLPLVHGFIAGIYERGAAVSQGMMKRDVAADEVR